MKKIKVLTIGNSFTESLTACFPQVTASTGNEVIVERANIGGCELARHWSYVEAEERNEICRIYNGGGCKLRDILASKDWNVVTIQQASHDSWRTDTFEPYATNLIAYIRKHAPGAEIMIQQTWAYRADHPQFHPGSEWGISQAEMYRRLTENYRMLGQRHGLRVIPSGVAVQLSRENEWNKFKNYPLTLLSELRWPDLPPQAGDVVGSCWWYKNQESGEMEVGRDLIHLNIRGQYLQACVWFAFLFGLPTCEIKYVPEEIGNTDAVTLRQIAQHAIERGV